MRIPLFPLHTVILPGGQLPLRIFETRYLDMFRDCMRDDTGFGVCQIREGSEAGAAAVPYRQGTLVRVADWGQGEDGLLNVIVEGQQKYTLTSTETMPDDLIVGEIELLPFEVGAPIPDKFRELADLLERVFAQVQWNAGLSPPQFDDTLWVGSRLLELLPMPKDRRQALFDCADPEERLDGLASYIQDTVESRN